MPDKDENVDQGKDKDNEKDRSNDKALVFDDWLKEQQDPVKTMLDGHTKGLKSALDGERDARKDLEKQVRELAAKSEKGSEAEAKLTALADEMSEADRKADFYEEAHKAGVTNLKLAYLAAVQDELFDRRGRVNFEGLKKSCPELFGVAKPPPADGGAGREGDEPAHTSMNEFIRKGAGR